MKVKHLTSSLILLLFCLASCKKENQYSIIGKWQQIKLRAYMQSHSGVVSNDSTYLRSSFNGDNYVQFNNDGTCIIGLYYPPNIYDPRDAVVRVSTLQYNYVPAGTKYVLTIPSADNKSGIGSGDTASINSNIVVIHSVFETNNNYIISDSYYSR